LKGSIHARVVEPCRFGDLAGCSIDGSRRVRAGDPIMNVSTVSARELASLVVESLTLEGVNPHQVDLAGPIFGEGLGLDSLDMLEISMLIQQRYDVKLKADDPRNETIFSSLQNLAAHVSAVQAARS
jgi:acyl carrier protein